MQEKITRRAPLEEFSSFYGLRVFTKVDTFIFFKALLFHVKEMKNYKLSFLLWRSFMNVTSFLLMYFFVLLGYRTTS